MMSNPCGWASVYEVPTLVVGHHFTSCKVFNFTSDDDHLVVSWICCFFWHYHSFNLSVSFFCPDEGRTQLSLLLPSIGCAGIGNCDNVSVAICNFFFFLRLVKTSNKKKKQTKIIKPEFHSPQIVYLLGSLFADLP